MARTDSDRRAEPNIDIHSFQDADRRPEEVCDPLCDTSSHSGPWPTRPSVQFIYFMVAPAAELFLGSAIGSGTSIVPIRFPISSRTAMRRETASSGTAKSMDA